MGLGSKVEGDQEFDSRQVRHPWTKGKRLDPGLIDDLQIPMFEAWDNEGKFFVVKEVQIDPNEMRQLQVEVLLQELKILCSLNHRNIVRYMGTEISRDKFQKTISISVFLKLMSQKPLLSIYKDYNRGLSELQVRCYTLHILNGLKYLHVDKKMVHGDIRCATIWVDDDGICKLTGFRRPEELIAKMDRLNSPQTTIPWTAREAFVSPTRRGFHSDIWSLGCTVIEMASGSPPYGELDEEAVYRKIAEREIPLIPDKLSEDGTDFVKQCLQSDYEKRPVVTDLLTHPFVRAAQHVIASEAQGSHSNMRGKNDPRRHRQPYFLNRETYDLYENEIQVASKVIVTTKTDTDELQGSEMPDRNKRFEDAKDTINSINQYRYSVDPEGPDELVLVQEADFHPEPSSESEDGEHINDHVDTDPQEEKVPPESSVTHYSKSRTYSKETFDERFNDICRKIESDACNLYILNGEWMGELAYGDKVQICNQFYGAGFFETINTEEFVCFENIASLSGVQLPLQLSVSSMDFTRCNDNVLPSTSRVGQTASRGGSSNTSKGEQGDSRKSDQWKGYFSNWLENISKLFQQIQPTSANLDTNGSDCGDACRAIKLQVSTSRISARSDTYSSYTPVLQSADQEFSLRKGKFSKTLNPSKSIRARATVRLSSCMEEGNFCIKLHFLKGEILKAVDGTIVKSLRISLAAKVRDEPIQLTCIPISNNTRLRVIDHEEASKDVNHFWRKHDVSFQISPTASLSPATLTPSVSLGGLNVTPKHQMQHLCDKDDDLTLVSLERGSTNACKDISEPPPSTSITLVLKRDLANTFLLDKSAELAAVEMSADLNPVKLIGKVSDLTTNDSENFEIVCYVELEISQVDLSEATTVAAQLFRKGERISQTLPFDGHFTMVRC